MEERAKVTPFARGQKAPQATFCDGQEGPLAQLVEQETLNLLVVGSIPTRPTKFNKLASLNFHRDAGATRVLHRHRWRGSPGLVT